VFLGNHQHVSGRLRINVLERESVLVFKNLLGGDFASDDAAKQAVCHGSPLESRISDGRG
jgi:hypothetical protein